MSKQEPKIRAHDVSVRLRRDAGRVRSLRQLVVERLEGRTFEPIWSDVLAGVSFDVARGELFAIIGANGAGKTTLLRALAGIVPCAGALHVEGPVAPLIELGAGFDPELTGVENVMLYGTILGMRRATLRCMLDDIVAFAGIGAAADAAVKTYSSGMIARLGFAVATASRPSVLLVDEVLAVGDERFRDACRARIDDLRSGGAAVVLVTHDLGLVARDADRVLWLDAGRARMVGRASAAVAAYQAQAGRAAA
jgi:ABC-type polysaccharide/polyol phosphate transport system ATPase subunit